MNDEPNENRAVSMNSLVPLIVKAAADGGETRVRVKGESMAPFLGNGRDTAIFSALPARKPKRGDIFLFRRSNGQYVMHRVYSVDKAGLLTFVGDGQTVLEGGIAPSQLVAYVAKVIRDGKEIDCTGGFTHRFMTLYMLAHVRHPRLICHLIDAAAKAKHLFIKG